MEFSNLLNQARKISIDSRARVNLTHQPEYYGYFPTATEVRFLTCPPKNLDYVSSKYSDSLFFLVKKVLQILVFDNLARRFAVVVYATVNFGLKQWHCAVRALENGRYYRSLYFFGCYSPTITYCHKSTL